MHISHHHQFISRSRDVANTIEGAQHLYADMTKFLGKVTSTIIAYLGIPVLNMILFSANKNFKKELENLKASPENAQDYKNMRQLYGALEESVSRLKNIGNPGSRTVPFGFRILNRQINDVTNSMVAYHIQIGNILNQVNDHKSPSSSFEFISEEQLWENRTKAYTYKI